MEIKIGVQYSSRELVLEVDDTVEAVEKLVEKAVADGGVLALDDTKGRRVLVPAAQLSYVELGTGNVGTVGFR